MRRTLLASLVVLSGCAATTDLDDPDHVQTWATTASALAVYSRVHDPIAFADGEAPFPDPDCPEWTDDGVTATLDGGCVTDDGVRYVGRVVIIRDREGNRDATFAGWGSGRDGVSPANGEVHIRQLAEEDHEFDIDLYVDALAPLTIDYSGRVQGTYRGPTTWNGEGTVRRQSFDPAGLAHAVTVDQVRDGDVCSNQPASGQTTIEIDDRVLVVTYDGATDCDEGQAAPYSVDGVDRGRVDGIGCSAAPGRRAPAWPLLVAAAALLLRRRPR